MGNLLASELSRKARKQTATPGVGQITGKRFFAVQKMPRGQMQAGRSMPSLRCLCRSQVVIVTNRGVGIQKEEQ
jgi:hypothetical protein